MPTKPSTPTPDWASNANFSSGPEAGQPTKVTPGAGELANGQVAGETYKCQWDNFILNNLALWIRTWVDGGSSAGAADAHIVETDANGAFSARAITVIGGAATTVGLSATGTTGAGPATGIGGTGVGAAPGLSGLGGNGALSGSGATLTGGVGVRGQSGTSAGTPGVLGVGNATGDHDGVQGIATGEGDGVYGLADDVNAAGVRGEGPGTGVLGNGTLAGVTGAPDDTSGTGVLGATAAAATSSARAVDGQALGDGTGVRGRGVDGYGVVAESDTSSPERSALRLVPQDAEPATALSGDVYFDDESVGSGPLDHDELRVRARGAWRTLMVETDGYTRAYARNINAVTATTTSVPQTVLSASLAAPNEPRRTGVVWLRVGGEIGRNVGGTTQSALLRLVDETDSDAEIETRTVALFQDGSDNVYERDVNWLIPYTLPDVGPRTFRLEIETTNGGAGNVRMRYGSVQIYGVL